MANVYLGIGTNLGDREANLRQAVFKLVQHGVEVVTESRFYETKPWGVEDQPGFLNMAVEVHTGKTAREVFGICKSIEQDMGRAETVRWGPRIIDIDILLYDDIVLDEPDLKIPHPHMHEREFVLKPLNEIAPQAVHPALKKTVGELFLAL